MSLRIRSLVEALMPLCPFRTFETVPLETWAISAIWLMVNFISGSWQLLSVDSVHESDSLSNGD
jgi:hypothetical protein